MTTAYWNWTPYSRVHHDSIEFDVTIHNDVGNFSDRHGLFLMLGYSEMSLGTPFYFGILTDIEDPVTFRWLGKALIFSRWGTRDLSNARVAPDGFAQSSGHEGDFIGVRRLYDWGAGDYVVRLGFESSDDVGDWFGLWITDESSGATEWMGSLRFPSGPGQKNQLISEVITVVEIYGEAVRPIDIPEWQVSMSPPVGDTDSTPAYVDLVYSELITNNQMTYDKAENRLHFVVGNLGKRDTDPGVISIGLED